MIIHRNDQVVLLKDITYTEFEPEKDEEKKQPASKKGEVGKVLRVFSRKRQVIVEGVNLRKKAVRPSQTNPKGGWIRKEMPIDISNVALFCPECGKGVRTGKDVREGKKLRICKKAGHVIPYPAS